LGRFGQTPPKGVWVFVGGAGGGAGAWLWGDPNGALGGGGPPPRGGGPGDGGWARAEFRFFFGGGPRSISRRQPPPHPQNRHQLWLGPRCFQARGGFGLRVLGGGKPRFLARFKAGAPGRFPVSRRGPGGPGGPAREASQGGGGGGGGGGERWDGFFKGGQGPPPPIWGATHVFGGRIFGGRGKGFTDFFRIGRPRFTGWMKPKRGGGFEGLMLEGGGRGGNFHHPPFFFGGGGGPNGGRCLLEGAQPGIFGNPVRFFSLTFFAKFRFGWGGHGLFWVGRLGGGHGRGTGGGGDGHAPFSWGGPPGGNMRAIRDYFSL